MTKTLLAPVISRKSLENTYTYAGGTISILLSGADTGGEFSVWEAIQRPGNEPALHVHHSNDESFLVLEGEMRFMVGDQILNAPAGSVVFAPRGVPHTFRIQSPISRVMTVCTPAGFERWFQELGRPARGFDLPDTVEPFTPDDFQKMPALGRSLDTDIIGEVDF